MKKLWNQIGYLPASSKGEVAGSGTGRKPRLKIFSVYFFILFVFNLDSALAADFHGRWDGDGGFVRPGGDFSPEYISRKWGKMGIHNPSQGIPNRSQVLRLDRQHSTLDLPSHGPGGIEFHASFISPRAMSSGPVRDHMGIVARDPAFLSQVRNFNDTERVAGQYYWHRYNGVDFCHYLDPLGHHWYGWYLGKKFFWTQFYWGFWWWYDPVFLHWCYWYDGWWWWQDPYHVIYVYEDGHYIPGRTTNGAWIEYPSEDGSRMVKLTGGDAFLYDTSGSNTFKPVYLASGVKEVEFSKPIKGKSIQILLVLNDGSFELFDNMGNPIRSGDKSTVNGK